MKSVKTWIHKLNAPITSLQFIQLFRFGILFLISIAFAKSCMSVEQIGNYEKFIYFAGALSFFWTNGLLQSLLGKYNSLSSSNDKKKYLFNAILVSVGFSILILFVLLLFQKPFSLFFINNSQIPNKTLFLLYLTISPVTFFIEYIYLLNKKYRKIYIYGIISYTLQFILVSFPAFFNLGLSYSLGGLVIITLIRLVWLTGLIFRYANPHFSWSFIKDNIQSSFPLILGAFIAGSIPYIDGVLVSLHFDDSIFAIYRYGAREFPVSLLLASAFSNAMIPVLSSSKNMTWSLRSLKMKSLQLMHLLFPLSILLMVISYFLFKILFNPHFLASVPIFNVMLLLIIPRMVFPQTILLSQRKNNFILMASTIEVVAKILFSIVLLYFFGLIGIALGTVIAFILEKIILIYFVKREVKIKPSQYIPFSWFLFYSCITVITYLIIQFNVIG